jgi:hypothetical protein
LRNGETLASDHIRGDSEPGFMAAGLVLSAAADSAIESIGDDLRLRAADAGPVVALIP